jgi:hypothetical protein
MGLIVDTICQDVREIGSPTEDLVDWRQRYEGVLMVAYLDGKAVAGISGPWPVNQFALTWWDRPVPARQLELFDSLDAAQRRVEEWAWRMRTIGVVDRPPANDPVLADTPIAIAPRASSWLGRLRDAIVPRTTAADRATREKVAAMRHPPLNEGDLRGIHFAAVE